MNKSQPVIFSVMHCQSSSGWGVFFKEKAVKVPNEGFNNRFSMMAPHSMISIYTFEGNKTYEHFMFSHFHKFV